MRKVLAKADSLGQNRHFTKGKSSGEEVLDEGEALWKIMEQVFTAQVIRYSRQKANTPLIETEDDSEKEDKPGSQPVKSAASSNFGKAKYL